MVLAEIHNQRVIMHPVLLQAGHRYDTGNTLNSTLYILNQAHSQPSERLGGYMASAWNKSMSWCDHDIL